MNPFSFGTDVEFFVADSGSLTKTVVPGSCIVDRPKEDPRVMPDGYRAHWDNAAVEVSSPVVYSNAGDAEERSPEYALGVLGSTCFKKVVSMVRDVSFANTKQYEIVDGACVKITADMEDAYPELLTFGCDPDYDPYTMRKNLPPDPFALRGLRTAGGHIHLGFMNPTEAEYDPNNPEHAAALARACDVFIGLPLAVNGLLSHGRMRAYGSPGAYRPKPEYPGIEYRFPCNSWAMSQVSLISAGVSLSAAMNSWRIFLEDDVREYSLEIRDYLINPLDEDVGRGLQDFSFTIFGGELVA